MAKKPTPTPEATAPAPVVSNSSEPVAPVIPEEVPGGTSSEDTTPVVPPGPVVETGEDLATAPDVTTSFSVDSEGMGENIWKSPWLPALTITAKTPRRRAGRRFTSEPTTILLSDLNADEIRLLREDMELSIQVVDGAADGETV